MSTQIKSAADIPAAPYYVKARDSFMSGWGGAKGKADYIILPCASEAEAYRVLEFVSKRREMKRAAVLTRKPALRKAGARYNLLTKESAPVWFGVK